jgi:hypothetical protein
MLAVRFILPPVILMVSINGFITVWQTYLTEFGG